MFATIKAYLWVAPYILIALLIALIFYYRSAITTAESHNIQLSTELKAVTETASQQRQTIVSLIELNAAKDKIVAGISDDIASINANTVQLGKDLTGLKESNPDVKAFSDIAVPPAVNELLNR